MAPKVQPTEKRRAIAIVYFLTPMVWTGPQQMEPLRWTVYLNECIDILIEEKETELDFLLIHQARCHKIMDKVTHFSVNSTAESGNPKDPRIRFVNTMLHKLQKMQQNLPPVLQSNKTALLHIYNTSVIIREAALHRPNHPESSD
ncbi:uncharacterized protein BDZ99DRAFT_524974 [Mytilinidion resinicola]|uniref:Uncharacterized protein n=1 Tax=Mytilinidion resinicola TaxID=574789 RepID=A0A6A6YB76_9PEZI|nr:uncharacterized protein BDZ99DRAFT_524974 [Mytilinidion resinicola]KAF2805264.1 hypothetical protein BDZ99DRAFT_524974 [Mytilinidion resinicola]